MGHTNKKKLDDLLDGLQNDSQETKPYSGTGNSGFDTSTDTVSGRGINSKAVDRKRIPRLDWEADIVDSSFLDLNKYRDEDSLFPKCPDAEHPEGSVPGLEEICRYVPMVNAFGRKFYLEKMDTGLYPDDKGLKFRCFASLLDYEGVPWKVSRFKHRIKCNSNGMYVQECAVVEFGIPYGGNDPDSWMQWKARNILVETVGSQEKESRVSNAEYSHEDAGVYYFPIASAKGEVCEPGVFGHDELAGYSTSHQVLDWEWIETLKRSSNSK